ncbi:MAG: DUF2125 domain-containing protein [Roseomonas sp.]|nr:DUF2125 domain-containing protein [Roseomonas sp.]MCA3382005.1 DUF2125 domain-containing protein [Roseomonas sp.]
MNAKPASPPRTPLLGRLLFGVLILLAALVAGQSLLWRWSTGALAEGFSDWVVQHRAQGWRIRHETPERSGWPFAARLSIPRLSIESPGDETSGQGLGWATEALALTTPLPWPDALRLEATGQQALRIGATQIPFIATSFKALLPLEMGQPPRRANALLQGMVAQTPDGVLSVQQLGMDANWTRAAEAALTLQFAAENAALPPAWLQAPALAGFGPRIARFEFDGALYGSVLPLPSLREQLDAWRASEGKLDVRQLRLAWGDLDAGLRLSARLDPALQPALGGTLSVTNPNAALDSLAQSGLIQRRALDGTKFAVGLLTRRPPNGGPPVAEIPIALQNGVVSVAQIPLTRLPPIVWPQH